MSVSGGTCRLCYISRQRQAPTLAYGEEGKPNQRRRRRLRNDDPPHQELQEQQQQQQQQQQPTLVMIQYDEDHPENAARKRDRDASAKALQNNQGIVLCKWLPTTSSFFRFSNAGDTVVEPNTENGSHVLDFDETVRVVLKDTTGDNQDHDHEIRTNSSVNGLLRSRAETDDGADGTNTARGALWNLRQTDPELVRRLDDRPEEPSAALLPCPRCHFEIEASNPRQSSGRQKGVAMPLYFPSISLRPIQSMVISIVGWNVTPSEGDRDRESNDRMSILMQAFWKRQLVGKVVAFDDGWTSRITLAADIHSDTDDGTSVYGDGDTPATSGTTVDAVIESCTPLMLTKRLPSSISKRGDYRMRTLSLPNNFYVVLPSTYITVQPAARQSLKETSTISSLDATPSPNATIIGRESSPRPPTAAASLLMHTLECIRSRGLGDGGDVPRTFLLSGPPGVGKTFSVSWVAKHHPDTLLCSIRGSELLQGTTSNRIGSNERNLSPARALELEFRTLAEAIDRRQRNNSKDSRAVSGLVFLDECDALVSVEPVAAMLANLLDRVSSIAPLSKIDEKNDFESCCWKRIVVVGATNRIGSIPSYLRRAGRFDRELPMSPPSAEKRAELLDSLLSNLRRHSSIQDSSSETGEEKTSELALPLGDEIQEIAELCVGYVAADLSALVRKAWLLCLKENNDNGKKGVAFSHLEAARNLVGASALRDASLAAPPKITWDDIAGDPGGAKTALRQAIEWPRLKAREFAILGLQPCRGILLHGPPGCAKTTLARAAAGSSGVAFLSLSPAQVYASSYVGEAERVVREAFFLARSTAPCILFFDEIDSIFGDGSNGNDSGKMGGTGRGSSAEARVLSTFLNEMDGVDIAGAGKDGVLVLGATNRPWTLDPALVRPGRLGDKIIFLPPPDNEARRSIFEKQFGNGASVNKNETDDKSSWDVDVSILVDLSEGMTGAEIVGACQEAKIQWMRETVLKYETAGGNNRNESEFRQQDCIVDALMSVKPLLSDPEALEEFQVFENRDKKKF